MDAGATPHERFRRCRRRRHQRSSAASPTRLQAIAFVTQQQTAGVGLSYLHGTGFVARRLHGRPVGQRWSAPSYLRVRGLGLGPMLGGWVLAGKLAATSLPLCRR